jgi:hypothetical protein
MTTDTGAHDAYRAARDQLLALHGRHEQAVAEFRSARARTDVLHQSHMPADHPQRTAAREHRDVLPPASLRPKPGSTVALGVSRAA